MNGDLERMVYNGTMDLESYNWWLNLLDELQTLGIYFLTPVVLLGIGLLILTYNKDKK